MQKVKEIACAVLGILALICVYKHPFLTIGIILVISAIAIPVLIQINHKENLKMIDSKIKHAVNCEYCGSEIVPGKTNCPNCGAPYDLENSKDLVQALQDEKISYNAQTKTSFSIAKFLLFLLFIPVVFVLVILFLAFLNDGQFTLHLL